MNPKQITTIADAPPLVSRLLRVSSMILAGILFLLSLTELRKMNVPGVNNSLIITSVLVCALVLIIQIPAVYYRLPDLLKRGAALSLLLALIVLIIADQQAKPAWIASPAGRKEEANYARQAAEEAAQEAKAEKEASAQQEIVRQTAEANNARQQLSQMNDKLEACFSWGHRLPALEDPIKNSLHNPSKFEHIETVLIVPDDQRNNVVMHFRAENGFGALRTAEVRAQLIADDCSIQKVGTPTIG